MIGMKKGVGHLSHKGVVKWLESIHDDTLKYGSEDQQFVLEQMIDYFNNDYREGKPLVNKNIIGY